MEFEKTDDGRLKVTAEKTITSEATYSLPALREQLATIEAQKVREISQRDAEIAEVLQLIAECEKLGIEDKG